MAHRKTNVIMKAGVIYNPHAREHKTSDDWLTFWQELDVDLQTLSDSNSLSKIIAHFVAQKCDLLFISGGDGTVQNVQTEYGNLQPKPALPILCLLPHGTTNMTAADVGLKSPHREKIRAILSRKDFLKRATNIKKRGTIKVDNVKDQRAQFGVFLGAGALYEAVRKFHTNKDSQKLTGHLATGKILLSEIYSALIGKKTEEDKLFRGYDISASENGTPFIEGEQLFLLVATLDKLILGSDPFWNQSSDGLKVTSAAWPLTRNLFSAIYQIMFASNRAQLRAPEFVSKSCKTIDLNIGSGCFTMDGEIFECAQNKPLKISLGPEFTYLCG